MWYMCGMWTACARTMARVCVRRSAVVMAYVRCAPPRVSPSYGIFREVALILLRLVDRGGGIFEGTFNEEFRVAGVKTEIVPAIILPLLGFSTFVLMKSPNFTPRIVCCPSWFKIFRPSKLFVN